MDPATWSWLTCAWLIQTSVGGILGNRLDAKATEVWNQSWSAFTQSLRGDCPTPINNDLEIAVHRAFLLAQRSLVCDCLAEFTGGTWTELGARPVAVRAGYTVLPDYAEADVTWLQAQLKEIKADLKKLQRGKYDAIPPEAFDNLVELLLTEQRTVKANAESLLRGDLLEGALIAGIPKSYQLRAKAEKTGLFERVAAFFAFELKTNAALQNLFQNQLLLQINQRLENSAEAPLSIGDVEGQLKTVAHQLPNVLASLDNLEIAVRDLGKGVDEVGWLVANRTDDLIALAISHTDDLAELKQMLAALLRQIQEQPSIPIVIVKSDSIRATRKEGENPFIYGPAVPPECFYGRKQQLAHIKQRIGGRVPQCVNVVGFRRSGKSSVLRYVKERIGEFCVPEQKPVVVLLDLQDKRFHEPIGILKGLRRGIQKQIGEAPWTQADDDDLFEVEDRLEIFRDQGYRLIVMFDEFEAVGERLEVFQDWGNHWRAQASAGRLSLVIASRRPISEIYQSLELTSPFDNIFSTIVLGAFTLEAWQTLLAEGNFSAEEVKWVHKLAGRLPYYTQLAADAVWQYGSFQVAHQSFLRQAKRQFEALWKKMSASEQLVLKHVVNLALSATHASVVEQLKLHGLIGADNQIPSESFANFVKLQKR